MKKERTFWGLFFIAAALLLIISKSGILNLGISLGLLLLAIIFVASLIKSAIHRNIPGVLFSLAFLYIIYAKAFGVVLLSPWTVLAAALLGSIGVSFLFRPHYMKWHSSHCDDSFSDVETIEGEGMNLETSFGSSIKYIHSEEFKQSRIHCSFGEMKVYFDNAKVPSGQAVVQMDVSFAGTELFIPKNWKVISKASVSFGGVEEKGRYEPDGSVTLILTGKVSFAGVTIIYV